VTLPLCPNITQETVTAISTLHSSTEFSFTVIHPDSWILLGNMKRARHDCLFVDLEARLRDGDGHGNDEPDEEEEDCGTAPQI
jgi:hypothetical protein